MNTQRKMLVIFLAAISFLIVLTSVILGGISFYRNFRAANGSPPPLPVATDVDTNEDSVKSPEEARRAVLESLNQANASGIETPQTEQQQKQEEVKAALTPSSDTKMTDEEQKRRREEVMRALSTSGSK